MRITMIAAYCAGRSIEFVKKETVEIDTPELHTEEISDERRSPQSGQNRTKRPQPRSNRDRY